MLVDHQVQVIWHRWTIFWGYVKRQISNENPQSIPELKDEIIHVISEIKPQLYQNI